MKNAKNNMNRGLYQDKKTCLTVTSHLAKVSLNSRDSVLLVNTEKELIEDLHQLKQHEYNQFWMNLQEVKQMFIGRLEMQFHQ